MMKWDLMWISVKDELPLEKYMEETKSTGIGIMDNYLVTVERDDYDPCDGREVMSLSFSTKDCMWRLDNGEPYDFGWSVTHWMPLPEPAEG